MPPLQHGEGELLQFHLFCPVDIGKEGVTKPFTIRRLQQFGPVLRSLYSGPGWQLGEYCAFFFPYTKPSTGVTHFLKITWDMRPEDIKMITGVQYGVGWNIQAVLVNIPDVLSDARVLHSLRAENAKLRAQVSATNTDNFLLRSEVSKRGGDPEELIQAASDALNRFLAQ
jgi:hypothetical protein